MMDSAHELMLNYLYTAIQDPDHARLDLQALPEDLREFGEGLVCCVKNLTEATDLAKSIARGNLDVKLPPPSNEIAAPIKSLHAALKHLTWQTQQVSKGDYQQRVDFMGDFSKAFNEMTEQLSQQREALLNEIENRQLENRQLLQNRNLYEILAGQIEQWIIVIDADTAELLLVSQEVDQDVMDPDTLQLLRQWLEQQAKAGHTEIKTAELELPDKRGARYYSATIHPIRWRGRNTLSFVLTDVSSERERLNNLQNIANHDTLTQLYNRRYGMQVLQEWLDEGRDFILCFADIDNLKLVNDRHGHLKGDQYIVYVSNTLRGFSTDAVVCRIGGDEFMLLCRDWPQEAARERMELLRGRIASHSGVPGAPYEHSISYGLISVGADNPLAASELLGTADERMYEYKRLYKLKRRRALK
jgi:diguanylate cyclase (GGDEF)-like protein